MFVLSAQDVLLEKGPWHAHVKTHWRKETLMFHL